MVSFSNLDIIIIIGFFGLVLFFGFLAGRKKTVDTEDYLLSGRKVGLILFILTNVATWYGGILGVGEFTYRYGLISWFTQGFPYYIFAIIFALLFAKKIRKASLFTIPDKIEETYGDKVAILAAILIFILVSPAPYLLMIGNLISMIFGIDLIWALILGLFISAVYLIPGGYRSDLYTDAFQFFVMFTGFIIIFISALYNLGSINFLQQNLPADHLKLTGNASPAFLLVWFLIALWTFTDPGFHQRCYAAKSGTIAVKGLIISVIFWALFDFFTTVTGLYARAVLPDLNNPVLAFPLFAEKILGTGLKGIFYAALFATIISTLNSFLFLSATTFGRDFVYKLKKEKVYKKIPNYTKIGLLVSSIISVLLAYFIDSVIELWYTIGSLCIPGIILLVISSYYERFQISRFTALLEMICSVLVSITWLILRPNFVHISLIKDIEPMLVGLFCALIIHSAGLKRRIKPFSS